MFFHEKTYDLDELAKMNLHTHSTFSTCAAREMILKDMVKAAEQAGLEAIAITDHNYIYKKNATAAQRLELLEQLAETGTKIKVLIGAELSSYDIGKFADDIETDNALDYRLYATNHYHQDYWVHPEDKSPRGYCRHMLAIMDKVIESGRADCLAHPFMAKYITECGDFHNVTAAFTDNEIGDIMIRGYERGVAWELNVPAILGDPVFFRRYFNIGREAGVIFNFGTDAHKLKNIDTFQFLPELKKILY